MTLSRFLRDYLKPLHERCGMSPDGQYTVLISLYMKLEGHNLITLDECQEAIDQLNLESE